MTNMITEKIDLDFSHFETIVEAKGFLEKLISKYGDMKITDNSYYEDYDVFCCYVREANHLDTLKAEYETARDSIYKRRSSLERERIHTSAKCDPRPYQPSESDSFNVVHSFIGNKSGVTPEDIASIKALHPEKALKFRYVDEVASMVEVGTEPYKVDMQKYEKELAEWLANESERATKAYTRMKEIDEEIVKIKQDEKTLRSDYEKASIEFGEQE